MANKQILYAAQALFVGPTPATGAQASGNILQLHRVQSVGYDFSRQLEDVQQYGNYAPIDRIELQLPQVSVNASYLATNVRNESGIGLYVGGDYTALKNILDDTQREKNYFLRIVPDGNGAAGYTGIDGGVVGFGNGVLASYQAQGQVGSFPTAQFTVAALDALWSQTSSNFDSPAINPNNGQPIAQSVTLPVATTGVANQLTVLRPGDVTLAASGFNGLAGVGFGISGLSIQSYNLQFDFNINPIQGLGDKFPTSREPQFPVNCQMSVEANMRELGTGRLSLLQCGDTKYDLTVTIRRPTCDGSLGENQIQYRLKQATLESQNFNTSIGPSKSVTLNFSSPIGGPQETDRGLFITGSLV